MKAASIPNKLTPVTPTRTASAALPEAVAEAEAEEPVAVEESESEVPVAVEVPVALESDPELSESEESVAWEGVPVEVK